MEWIDIKKELPQPNEVVFTYRPTASNYGDDVFTMDRFVGVNSFDLNGIPHGFCRNHHVTHWMRPEIPVAK